MSKSSPGHFVGSADAFYEPDYTTQISSRMQVPDKIRVIEGAEDDKKDFSPSLIGNDKPLMHVPDRILVAGGDEHIGAREILPELRLESALTTEPPQAVLTAPPRILTMNHYNYPGLDLDKTTAKEAVQTSHNLSNGLNESAVQIVHAPEDELSLLRMQLKLLRTRVSAVETENQLRQQREVILYSAGVIYFIFKGLIWLHRHL